MRVPLKSALSTADPHLQALAWDLKARVAIGEKNWTNAQEYIQHALVIVEKFEILVAAWQSHATALQLYLQLKEDKAAEMNRERAETCILKIANSFEPDEPLRATFLAAAPIDGILGERVVNKAAQLHPSRRGARRVPEVRKGLLAPHSRA